jgi:hypothetical protein
MANTLKFGNGQWATKVGSTLAYNDENGNFKPLPFNFTRSTGGTRVNKDGLIEMVTNNKPRIDFLNDSNGALLLEPNRMNLITYSEAFDNGIWTTSGVSVTSGTISPDGTANAFKLVESSTSAIHYIKTANITVSNSTTYTMSFFAKKGERNIAVRDGSSDSFVSIDLTNNLVLDSLGLSTSIELISNGWYRIDVSYLSTSTICAFQLITLSPSYTSGSPWSSYTGDGTSGVYIYGAQLELGSYATSYIPTQGATATRVAEVCTGAGNDQVINSAEGVLYAEIEALADDSDSKRITISDGTLANRITISVSDNIVSGFINVNNVTQYTFYESNQNVLSPIKIAVKYKANDFAIWISGVEYDASTSGTTFPPSTLTQLSFDNAVGANVFYGNVKDLQVFTTALTDAELIALTTI